MLEYLPIGSIITMNYRIKKVMIVGIAQVKKDNREEMYDYVGVTYPLGINGEKSFIFFNKEDIVDVIFKGYSNSEQKEFMELLNEIMSKEELKTTDNNDNAFE